MDADKAAADALADVTFYATEERGKALRAVAAKLREYRREALEEACKAMCEWCRAAGPYKISGSVRWWHQDGICEAAPIRDLIEGESR